MEAQTADRRAEFSLGGFVLICICHLVGVLRALDFRPAGEAVRPDASSGEAQVPNNGERVEEGAQPMVEGGDAVEQAPAVLDDLTGDLDEAMAKGFEFHAYDFLLSAASGASRPYQALSVQVCFYHTLCTFVP